MKLRKIITMGLAAIMAVSAMSISAFAAADTETKSTVSRYEETSDTGETYTVVEATIYPGEAVTPQGFATRELLLLDTTVSNTTSYTNNNIKCYSGAGNSLNVWVRNNGSRTIKARFTYTTGSKPDIEIGGLGGYTFNDTQSSDLTGTYKLYVRDAENTSEKINITVRARQFEA